LRTIVQTRRDLLARFLVVVVGAAAGCSSERKQGTSTAQGFADRFAQFQAAPEPNGDLGKVVWPDYVIQAGPEVKRLYEFQITHGELMRYMPCFCGCGQNAGHKSNRDCYVREVREDGSVVFDSMAPT
jgi:hypothetical protein